MILLCSDSMRELALSSYRPVNPTQPTNSSERCGLIRTCPPKGALHQTRWTALMAGLILDGALGRVENVLASIAQSGREGHSRRRIQSVALTRARSVEGELQITRVNRARRS